MSHMMTDQELMDELILRFARSRKAFHDLTIVNLRLREVNQKLEQSERLKSSFLSNIRNEINNPLTTLMGMSSQIMALAGQSEELSQLAAMIHWEAFNLNFQLHNIFMAAELEAGAAMPSPTLIALDCLLAEALKDFQHLAKQREISVGGGVQTSPDEPAPQITCPTEMVALIMANLLSNAIKFSHQGGHVNVTLAIQNNGLQLQVTDTGIGILEEDIPRIFDRFVQLDSGTTRAHLGQGLGLSVVKSLIDLLEGRIDVSSVPHQGTTVTVWIPDMQAQPGEASFGVGGNLFLFETEPNHQS